GRRVNGEGQPAQDGQQPRAEAGGQPRAPRPPREPRAPKPQPAAQPAAPAQEKSPSLFGRIGQGLRKLVTRAPRSQH
ncbi:hypothetical protein ACFOD5_14220, partial [Luteimonas padinae]